VWHQREWLNNHPSARRSGTARAERQPARDHPSFAWQPWSDVSDPVSSGGLLRGEAAASHSGGRHQPRQTARPSGRGSVQECRPSHVNGATRSLPASRTCPWAGTWRHSPSGRWFPSTLWKERWERQERRDCTSSHDLGHELAGSLFNSPSEPIIGQGVSFGMWPRQTIRAARQLVGRLAPRPHDVLRDDGRDGARQHAVTGLFGGTGRVRLHGQERGQRTPRRTRLLRWSRRGTSGNDECGSTSRHDPAPRLTRTQRGELEALD